MMRPLASAELLDAWESGWMQTPARRALLLLAAASPETTRDDLAALPIGERDARLMTLREWTFGTRVVGVTGCPACGERLEMDFNLGDIRAGSPAIGDLKLRHGAYNVQFRLPNTLDLLALEKAGEGTGKQILLERCVMAVSRRGKAYPLEQLPVDVVAAVADHMAEADPQADVRLALVCQACRHQWDAAFDIVTFFWNEIHAWALRTLQDIHQLASAYGWREADILALSPWRRQIYLEMVSR